MSTSCCEKCCCKKCCCKKCSEVYESMKRDKICTTIYLVLGAAFVVADMASDCWVAATWWHRTGYHFYARIAIGILCVSAYVPVMAGLTHFDPLVGNGEGLRLRVLFHILNIPVVFFMFDSLYKIWRSNKNPADFWGASSDEASAKGTIIWKTFEFVLEACPQLFLQTYVATYELYGPHSIGVQPILATSIALSTFSIASGLANHWLANESLGGYCLGGIVLASMLVARLCTFVAVFVEFGKLAWIAAVVVFLAHAGAAITMWWASMDWDVWFVTFTALIPLAIVPLGSQRFGRGNVGYDVTISHFLTPFFHKAARIVDVLLSPLGKVNFVLHVVGNCIMLLLVAILPSRGDRPDVSGGFLLLFGVLPMAIGIVTYVAIFIIYEKKPESSGEDVAQELDEAKADTEDAKTDV